MSYAYILHKQAQNDYDQSLEWYLERSVVAGEKFVLAVEDALGLICDNPTRWRKKYKNFHEISLKKYPFTIIYTIEEDKLLIVVLSIYHYKRKPKGKYRKI